MAKVERVREILSSPPMAEYWQEKAAAGWRPVAVEWEREVDGVDEDGRLKQEVPYGLKVADDCLYLVVEGVVHITRGETLLAEMGPGDFFGEIALFEGVARSATAQTRGRARLLGLERADLMRLIDDSPGIAVGLLQTLSMRVRELTDRLMV